MQGEPLEGCREGAAISLSCSSSASACMKFYPCSPSPFRVNVWKWRTEMKRNQTSQTPNFIFLIVHKLTYSSRKNQCEALKNTFRKSKAEMIIYRRKDFISWLCNPCKRIQGKGWQIKGHLYWEYFELIVMLTYLLALEKNKIFAELRNITGFNAERICWWVPRCQGCKGRMVKHPVEHILRIYS